MLRISAENTIVHVCTLVTNLPGMGVGSRKDLSKNKNVITLHKWKGLCASTYSIFIKLYQND